MSDKQKAFEELIKELRPILRKSLEVNYGSASKKHSEHTVQGLYKGFEVIVQLK